VTRPLPATPEKEEGPIIPCKSRPLPNGRRELTGTANDGPRERAMSLRLLRGKGEAGSRHLKVSIHPQAGEGSDTKGR